MQLAKEAYEAYVNKAGWQCPQWNELSDEIKQCWIASACWVAGKVSGNHDWQIPIKDGAFADRIQGEAMAGCNETDHMAADDLLCDLLLAIGCTKSVEAFRKVEKWYA